MERNVGIVDSTIRTILGIIFLGIGFFSQLGTGPKIGAYAIGAMPLLLHLSDFVLSGRRSGSAPARKGSQKELKTQWRKRLSNRTRQKRARGSLQDINSDGCGGYSWSWTPGKKKGQQCQSCCPLITIHNYNAQAECLR